MPNIDRSEVVAALAAFLFVFAPTIHRLHVDQWVNLDLTYTPLLIVLVIGIAAYFLHRGSKAA